MGKYHLGNISVHGLMIVARGTIPKHLVHLWDALQLNKSYIHDIVFAVIRGSIVILRNSLYN